MLSDKQRADYIEDPSQCPYCANTNIVGGSIYAEGCSHAVRRIDCVNCGLSWDEVFKVTSLADID